MASSDTPRGRFLGGILGKVRIPQEGVGIAEGHILKACDQFAEGGMPSSQGDVPGLCQRDQRFNLVHP